MSSKRLCVRISNCSRDFLSVCGDRSTLYLLILVGSGIGPAILAPVRLAVSTISPADWSRSLWSYALRRMRMRGVVMVLLSALLLGRDDLFEDLRHDAGADGLAALADREAE